MKLTEKRIRDLAPKAKQYFVFDEELPGFGVRVGSSGEKSFVIRYRTGGGRSAQQRRITLCKVQAASLSTARDEARSYLAEVRKGNDPYADKLSYRVAPICNDLFDKYLDEHAKIKKSEKSVYEDTRLVDRHLRPAVGRKKVVDIQFEDIERLHQKMRHTPYQANRVLAITSKAFQLAERWQMRPPQSNPSRLVERFKETPRDRHFSVTEISDLGSALNDLEDGADGTTANPVAILALRLALILGLRIGEIRNLRWDDVDLERQSLALTSTKTGARNHSLPTIAQQLLAEATRKGPFVICGKSSSQPLNYKSIHNVWKRARDRAGLSNARIHDFRHTVATMAAETGAGAALLRDLLGHKTMAMANLYIGRLDKPVRDLREQVAGTIGAAISDSSSADVVNLKFVKQAIRGEGQ